MQRASTLQETAQKTRKMSVRQALKKSVVFRFIESARHNPEVFFVGALSLNIIPAAIFLHYVMNQNMEAVKLLLVAYICTLYIGMRSFPDFVDVNKSITVGFSDRLSLLLHCVRLGCLAWVIYIYPTDNLSTLFVIFAFFVIFDVFLIKFYPKQAMVILLLNAALMGLVYPRNYPFLLFLIVAVAQVVVYLIHRVFRRIIHQQQELVALNQQIDAISTESERLRLRHDLHDSLGHELTALSMEVALLESESDHDSDKLSSMKSRVKHINRVIREIIENRHVNVDMSVQAIIHQQITRVPKLVVDATLPDSPIFLVAPMQKLLVSGVLELLTNALKYSSSPDVSMTMQADNEQITLSVTNNIVADMSQTLLKSHSSSMGLQLLRERLESMAGSMVMSNKQGQFSVTLYIPLQVLQH